MDLDETMVENVDDTQADDTPEEEIVEETDESEEDLDSIPDEEEQDEEPPAQEHTTQERTSAPEETTSQVSPTEPTVTEPSREPENGTEPVDGPSENAAPDDGDSNEPWPECSHWPAGDRPLPDRDDEPSGAPFDPDSPDTIVHRQYSIRPSNRPSGLSASDNAEKWHDWFAEKGVAWPAGSSVSFFPTLGKLVVANTRKNLDRVESLLKSAAKPSPGP